MDLNQQIPPAAPRPEISSEPASVARSRWRLPLIIVGGAVVLASLAVGAVLMFGGPRAAAPAPGYGNLPPGGQSSGGDLPPEMGTPTSSFGGTPLPGQMVVDWYQWPVPSHYTQVKDVEREQQVASTSELTIWNTPSEAWKVYKVGKVTAGPYTGGSVYIAQGVSEMGGAPSYRVVAVPKAEGYGVEEVIVFGAPDWAPESWTRNDVATFANLEPPEIIPIPGSAEVLRRADASRHTPGSDILLLQLEDPEQLFEYAPGRYVYKSDQHDCFFVAAADGTLRAYLFDWQFIVDGVEPVSYNPHLSNVISLTPNGGQPVQAEYQSRRYACGGYGSCYNYVHFITSESQLKVAARTSDGQPLYELADPAAKESPQARESLLRSMYNSYYPGPDTEKVSFETFVADLPLLFWRDPYGDYVQLTKAKYVPAAECGKPVIYLYPEREMDVAVQVAPNGGFTVTEPEYPDGGWKVRAKPSGELHYYADGKTYPYLFWEGYATSYSRPAEGFVVAQKDVEAFLRTTLPKLGLVPHEYDEFIAFWLPRMQDQPYYFISFMPQADFDRYAPLNVSPKPDTVIRVFMDYEGLNAPIAVRQPEIRTPERRGFTVVEWGGALH